jgi:hypothetical protein
MDEFTNMVNNLPTITEPLARRTIQKLHLKAVSMSEGDAITVEDWVVIGADIIEDIRYCWFLPLSFPLFALN